MTAEQIAERILSGAVICSDSTLSKPVAIMEAIAGIIHGCLPSTSKWTILILTVSAMGEDGVFSAGCTGSVIGTLYKKAKYCSLNKLCRAPQN